MNQNQQILVTLLVKAIRNENIDKSGIKNADWENIFLEAKKHEVHTLLYPLLKNSGIINELDSELISEWEYSSVLAGVTQLQHVNEISRILELFNESNISVIAVKGLVLRDLYPHPELRIMSDADLLIHKSDLNTAKRILKNLNYSLSNTTSCHAVFTHEKHLPIELHWALASQEHLETAEIFEADIWNQTTYFEIESTPVLTLRDEKQLAYLFLHMAVHMLSSGFGLRQLCDLVLFIHSRMETINWNAVLEDIRTLNLERFSLAVLAICDRLFGLTVPSQFANNSFLNDANICLFIEDIISGGIYGKEIPERKTGSLQLRFSSTGKGHHGKLIFSRSFLFPSAQNLKGKYVYAQKTPLLVPIAWIHRILDNAFRKDISIAEKKTILFSSSSDVNAKKRMELLRWLEL